MIYNEDYLTGMEHIADAITCEIDRLDKYSMRKVKIFMNQIIATE